MLTIFLSVLFAFNYLSMEEDVVFESPTVTIAGTFTRPAGPGPYPAVILIAGSGAMDRDETVCGHKPFLLLANHLASHGIAVLRCDKRGVGGSTGHLHDATLIDLASDVHLGIDYLKQRKDISSIGLLGHSQGGMIAPIVAAQSEDIAFIVMMAAPGVLVEELLYEQAALLVKAAGGTEEQITITQATQKTLFDILKEETDPAKAKERLVPLLPSEEHTHFINNPWFRHLLTYDPAPVLEKIHIPVLALNGDLDLQVSAKQNLSAIQRALEHNCDTTILELPKHNHLFQTCETGSFTEYEKSQETLSPLLLNTVTEWILHHCHFLEHMDISSLAGKNIAYYVGSFDPPHLGHKGVVDHILKEGLADYVIVYPVPGGDTYKNRTDIHTRKEMIHTLFRDNLHVLLTHLSPYQLQVHFSPHIDTCTILGVLGSDAILDPLYKDKYSPYFFCGHPLPDKHKNSTLGAIMALPATSLLVPIRKDHDLTGITTDRPFQSFTPPQNHLSSTKVRAARQANESLSSLVTPEIETIIHRKGLYHGPK